MSKTGLESDPPLPAGFVVGDVGEHGGALIGDGDGTRRILVDSPGIDVRAAPPAQLLLTLPTTAHPGEAIRLAIAFLDIYGNAGSEIETELTARDAVGRAVATLVDGSALALSDSSSTIKLV